MAVKLFADYKVNSQSAATNKSNVTVSVMAQWSGGSYNTLQKPGTLTIDGTSYSFTSSFNEKQSTSGTKTLFTKTVDIQHDSEGKKKLTISAKYETGVSSGTISASIVEDLPRIALASSVAATDAYIGAVSMVAVTKRATAYKHSVNWAFGSRSGWLAADGSISDTEIIMSETSVPFTLPNDFYKEIPNAASGVCTLTCTTYSEAAVVGSSATAKFTVSANPAAVSPGVVADVTDINSKTTALTGDSTKMIRYMSNAKCDLKGTLTWYNATITEARIGGVVVQSNGERTIEGIETNSVEFRVTDSRGFVGSKKVEFEMVPYIRLTNEATASRVDPKTGSATLTLKGNFYNGSFGAKSNTITVKISVDGGNAQSVLVNINAEKKTYGATVEISNLDYRTSHTIEVTVSDKLDAKSKTVEIGKSIPVYCWGDNHFDFLVPVAFRGGITPGYDAGFNGTAAELSSYLKKLVAAGCYTALLTGSYEVAAKIPIPAGMTIIGGTFTATEDFADAMFSALGDNVRLIGVTLRAPAHNKTPSIHVGNNRPTDALCSNVIGMFSNEHNGIELIRCTCDKIIPAKLNRGYCRIENCHITDAPMFIWSTGAKLTAIGNNVEIADVGLDYYYHVYYCDGDAELLSVNNRIRCDTSVPYFDVYHLMTAGNDGTYRATGLIQGDVVTGNFQYVIDCHYADLVLEGCTIHNTNTGAWTEFSNTAHSSFRYMNCDLHYEGASEQTYDSSMSAPVEYHKCRIVKNSRLNRRAVYNGCRIEQYLESVSMFVNNVDAIGCEFYVKGTPQCVGVISSGTLVTVFVNNVIRFVDPNTSLYLFNYASINGVIAGNVVEGAADGTAVWKTDRGSAHNNVINGLAK